MFPLGSRRPGRRVEVDRQLERELYNRGREFQNFMSSRGVWVTGRYQYKVLAHWVDQQYYSLPLDQHVQDFEVWRRARVEAHVKASRERHELKMMRSFVDAKSDPSKEARLREKAEADARASREKHELMMMRSFVDAKGNQSEGTAVVPVPSTTSQQLPKHQPLDQQLLLRLIPGYYNTSTDASRSSTGVQFSLSPLPADGWIRLLVLEPRSKSELACHIYPIELKHAIGSYEALSYRWSTEQGRNAAPPAHIKCNDANMPLSQDLQTALSNLRYARIPRILWIDALCIDQTNDSERASQVQCMGSVYSGASRTVIWLGDVPDHDSVNAFEAVCWLVSNQNPAATPSYQTKLSKSPQLRLLKNGGLAKHCLDVAPLFRSGWFERRWVIQEVALAKRALVVVPGASMDWEYVALAAAVLRTNYLDLMRGAGIESQVCNAYLVARLAGHAGLPALQPNVLSLLRLTTEFKTTEPLDLVFALLGLLSVGKLQTLGGAAFSIPVDYTWTLEELMRQVAERLMALPMPLAFLSDAADVWESSGAQAPSWLPCFGKKDRSMLDPWTLGGSAFNPTDTLPFKRWASSSSVLAIDGICFSPIVRSFGCLSDEHQLGNVMVAIFTLVASADPALGEPEILALLSRTMTGARDGYGNLQRDRHAYTNDFAGFLVEWDRCFESSPTYHWTVSPAVADLASLGRSERFLNIARPVCSQRTLFLTASGHIGIGPARCKVGDEICALGGATMLHALRRDTAGQHSLIGDCFVDGLMDGEIVAAQREGKRLSGQFNVESFLEPNGTSAEFPEADAPMEVQRISLV